MKTRFFALAALALALAACNNDNEILNNDGPVAAKFAAGITPVTRASGTTWDAGDRIGITGIGTVYDNVPYILKNGTFEAEGTVIYFQTTEEVVFRAYYPYSPTGGPFPVTTDADAQENQPAIDLLFASGATGSTSNPDVEFTDKTDEGGEDHSFHHCMSQITLAFEEGSGVNFDLVKPAGYTLSGLKLEGSFDTASGTATVGDQAQAKDLTLTLDGAVRSSLILIPQEANTLPLKVTYNGQTYYASLTVPEGELKAGDNYIYTVTVRNKGIEVSKAAIAKWNDVDGGEVGADL